MKEEIGKIYHRLTIVREMEKHIYPSGDTRRKFLALCSCGSFPKTYLISELRSGRTKSCGCLNKEQIKSHGMYNTRAYQCWVDMKTRCDNPENKYYKDYGGRGITYCEKWKTFQGFWEDMQETYSEDLTLNRRDNDGNYCKENCEWDNKNFQNHMKRKLKGTKLESIGTLQNPDSLMFSARIKINKKCITLGVYTTEACAAKAYDDASEFVYGDRPNKTLKAHDKIYEKVHWYLANKDEDIRKIKNPAAKMTPEKVLEIVKLFKEGVIQTKLAEMFGVNQSTISSICRGDSWSSVTGIIKKIH